MFIQTQIHKRLKRWKILERNLASGRAQITKTIGKGLNAQLTFEAHEKKQMDPQTLTIQPEAQLGIPSLIWVS